MYVLSVIDLINYSSGERSLTDHVELMSVSESLEDLKTRVDEIDDVVWETNDMNQVIGTCLYDGVREEDQYYVIVKF